jgi:hypothetical protein
VRGGVHAAECGAAEWGCLCVILGSLGGEISGFGRVLDQKVRDWEGFAGVFASLSRVSVTRFRDAMFGLHRFPSK